MPPNYLYLYTFFDQRRLDIIDKVEYGVHNRLHIYSCVGYFTSTGIDSETPDRKDQRLLVSIPKDSGGKVG